MPEHVRSLTSARVLAVERELVGRITARAVGDALTAWVHDLTGRVGGLDADQTAAVAHLTGTDRSPRRGRRRCGQDGQARRRPTSPAVGRMLVVTPTRKAAQVAERQVGAASHSVAWLLHQHGYRWDDDGHWRRVAAEPDAPRLEPPRPAGGRRGRHARPGHRPCPPDLADASGCGPALVGDRHQLPAVGPWGGARPRRPVRTRPDNDPERGPPVRRPRLRRSVAADASRRDSRAWVFDELVRRGEIVVHASEVERDQAFAVRASRGELVMADTREQVGRINGLAHQVRVATGEASDGVMTGAGERIGVGDRIATRRNDPDTGVANRETWTVIARTSAAAYRRR